MGVHRGNQGILNLNTDPLMAELASSRIPPSHSLVQNLRQQVMQGLPFSKMAEADVDFFLSRSREAYFAPKEVILSPADGAPEFLYLIRQGRVSGRRDIPGIEETAFSLDAGSLFSIGSAFANRPVSTTYSAIDDCFCLLFPVATMRQLQAQSKPFSDFLSNRIWGLLQESRTALRNSFASQALADQSLESRLGDLHLKKPLTTGPNTPLREALTLIHEKKVGSILVTEDERTIVGILTRYDVLSRVTLSDLDLNTPISAVMSTGVKTLSVDDTAEMAGLLMSRFNIRHLPILESGRLVGIISERDLFSLQRLSLSNISTSIRATEDLQGLKKCADDIRTFARNLLGQGVQARQLTALISHLNDVLTEQLIAMVASRYQLNHSRFAWIALGSEGRSEQTIATDQDNALVYADEDGEAQRAVYLQFAREVNEALDVCGYPLCKGNIMASNPELCLSQQEWLSRFDRWIEQGNPEDLLKASIFFDLRALAGNPDLLIPLKELVRVKAAAIPRFIKLLAENALNSRVPLNWLGAIEPTEINGQKTIDLKVQGTALMVDAARIYSLAHGIESINTRERLAAVGRALNVPEVESAAWITAFEFLQTQRLAVQIAEVTMNGNPNAIDIDQLNSVDRSILKESLLKVRSLQQHLQLDYVR
jgi:CBS domain-containing protein